MREEVTVKLKPVYMKSSDEYIGAARARCFQKKLADTDAGLVLLSAPTGSGKTVTLLTEHRYGLALGLYPNNELICSQVAGLHNFIVRFVGMKGERLDLLESCWDAVRGKEVDREPLNIYSSDAGVEIFGRRVRRLYVLGLSGKLIKRTGEETKLQRIRELLRKVLNPKNGREDSYAILLGTPDTFFLLATYSYRDFSKVGKVLDVITKFPYETPEFYEEILRKMHLALRETLSEISSVVAPFLVGSTVFIDEFHLYGPIELSSLKLLIYALKINGFGGRIVLSTATPNPEALRMLEDEYGSKATPLDALNDVKTDGDADELVRGETVIKFLPVGACSGNTIKRRFACSEGASSLLDVFAGVEGRFLGIVEKVGHAELLARSLLEKLGVKPVCFYSTYDEAFCLEPTLESVEGASFIVGSGAGIGQGVEFRNVKYGIVARVTPEDYLQSISRICRGVEGGCLVATPLCSNELEKISDGLELDYRGFVEWLPSSRLFYAGSRNKLELIRKYLEQREHVLRRYIAYSFYRETGSRVVSVEQETSAEPLKIIATPDELGNLARFRQGSLLVFIRRNEVKEEREVDYGVVVRNYDFIVDRDGVLRLIDLARGSGRTVEIECKETGVLEELPSGSLVGRSFLNLLGCTIKGPSDEGGTSPIRHEGGELFLYVNIDDSDFADYLSVTGRGIRISSTNGILIPL